MGQVHTEQVYTTKDLMKLQINKKCIKGFGVPFMSLILDLEQVNIFDAKCAVDKLESEGFIYVLNGLIFKP